MTNFDELIDSGGCITWVNHYSIQMGAKSTVEYRKFTAVGFDGLLLRRILGGNLEHSSADVFLPALLIGRNLRVLLAGGTPDSARLHSSSFSSRFPDCVALESLAGDKEVLESLKESALNLSPDLIILGLGPGLQDLVALELFEFLSGKNQFPLIVTCGGWLDQLSSPSYFPLWSYRLRLNWLLRLVREPRRLWKRYTYWAALSLIRRKVIRRTLKGINVLS